MVTNDLIVEDLLLLQLLLNTLNFFCNLEETLTLVLFIGWFAVTQV